MTDIDELERLAKAAIAAIDNVPKDINNEQYDANLAAVSRYAAMVGPAAMLPLIAELREYRHLCAQVLAVYDSDSGYGDGMVSMCYRNSQCRGAQVVEAVLQWQQRADESADLRIGIRNDMD